jgi:hypothetical protein
VFSCGNAQISNLPLLTSLTGVEQLEYVSRLYLGTCPELHSLTGLGGLVEAGQIDIVDASVSDLTGLEGLTTLGSLIVSDNTALLNLHGLEQLSGLDADLAVTGNTLLSNLHALDSLGYVSGSFVITGNPSLPTCEAERLRDLIGIADIGQTPEIAAVRGDVLSWGRCVGARRDAEDFRFPKKRELVCHAL